MCVSFPTDWCGYIQTFGNPWTDWKSLFSVNGDSITPKHSMLVDNLARWIERCSTLIFLNWNGRNILLDWHKVSGGIWTTSIQKHWLLLGRRTQCKYIAMVRREVLNSVKKNLFFCYRLFFVHIAFQVLFLALFWALTAKLTGMSLISCIFVIPVMYFLLSLL